MRQLTEFDRTKISEAIYNCQQGNRSRGVIDGEIEVALEGHIIAFIHLSGEYTEQSYNDAPDESYAWIDSTIELCSDEEESILLDSSFLKKYSDNEVIFN